MGRHGDQPFDLLGGENARDRIRIPFLDRMEACPGIERLDQGVKRQPMRERPRTQGRRRIPQLENDPPPVEAPAPLLARAAIGLRLGCRARGKADQEDPLGIDGQLVRSRGEIEGLGSGNDDRNAMPAADFGARARIAYEKAANSG